MMTRTRTYLEMITAVRLVNTSVTSHTYHLFPWGGMGIVLVRTSKISFLNLQVYSTVWLTVVTMLNIIDPPTLFIFQLQAYTP